MRNLVSKLPNKQLLGKAKEFIEQLDGIVDGEAYDVLAEVVHRFGLQLYPQGSPGTGTMPDQWPAHTFIPPTSSDRSISKHLLKAIEERRQHAYDDAGPMPDVAPCERYNQVVPGMEVWYKWGQRWCRCLVLAVESPGYFLKHYYSDKTFRAVHLMDLYPYTPRVPYDSGWFKQRQQRLAADLQAGFTDLENLFGQWMKHRVEIAEPEPVPAEPVSLPAPSQPVVLGRGLLALIDDQIKTFNDNQCPQ